MKNRCHLAKKHDSRLSWKKYQIDLVSDKFPKESPAKMGLRKMSGGL
jgi:hypothetical protein